MITASRPWAARRSGALPRSRESLPPIAERVTAGARADERCSWLQSSLDLSDAELKKVMMRSPQVLGLSVEATLEPKLDWLQDRLDLDAAQLKKMVLRLPAVLSRSVEDNFSPRLDWLQMRLDLDDAGLRMMVLQKPAVLGYSIEDKMVPKLDWLQSRLDLNETELKQVIVTFPSLFSVSISIEGNMEPKLGFFEEGGLSPLSWTKGSASASAFDSIRSKEADITVAVAPAPQGLRTARRRRRAERSRATRRLVASMPRRRRQLLDLRVSCGGAGRFPLNVPLLCHQCGRPGRAARSHARLREARRRPPRPPAMPEAASGYRVRSKSGPVAVAPCAPSRSSCRRARGDDLLVRESEQGRLDDHGAAPV